MHILRYYILRQHLVPFLLGFGVVTFILEMDVLFQYLDLVINRGVAVGVVAQVFLLSLGYIVPLSVPCAVLVSTLMTFGRLSQDNEITALRAIGINLASVLTGPLAAATVLTVALILFGNYVLPETNHAFMNLLIDIGRMRPTVKMQEGVFINDFPGYNLLVQSINGRTNEMRGVTIYQLNPGAPPTTILAKSGFLSFTPDGRTAVLQLRDGEIHEIPPDGGGSRRYHRLVFKRHTLNIPGAGGMLEHTERSSRSDREKSARDMLDERTVVLTQYRRSLESHESRVQSLGVAPALLDLMRPDKLPLLRRIAVGWRALLHGFDPLEQIVASDPRTQTEIELWRMERDALERRAAGLSVEIHKKFSLPVACIVFILIGAPLGMRVRRAGPAIAFVSIGFFLFYWLCLIGGEELANRLLMPPWLAMWLPNIVLGIWGLERTLNACDIVLPWSRRGRRARALRGAAVAAA